MTHADFNPIPARWWLFATAFISGAVVMALEILGSRLLAPVFGNSLFVWGALIGVILAAMSSGYATGGWLADRYHGGSVLAGLLLGSGVWTFLLAWKGYPVMFAVAEWVQDPRWGPCLAAGLLLAPPAFGLSGVLPALLRLSIDDIGHLGRYTGRMIAISTVGSLAGTWGTAFYLLSWLGSVTLVAILGAIQVGLGGFWGWYVARMRAGAAARLVGGSVIVLVSVTLGWLAWHPDLVLPTPLYQEDSPYQQIRVRDTDLHRYLILDRTFHAVMWRVEPVELFLPYSQMMMAALSLVDQPRRALILGHGGGSLAKWLAKYWPELDVDVVEVDPSVVLAAERFFNYSPPPRHHVYVRDARVFLQSTAARYDIIWVDVFARHLIPFHLTTREFFEVVRDHLTPDGVIAVNLSSAGTPADRLRSHAVVSTLRTQFPEIVAYGVKGPFVTKEPDTENLIFFAGSPARRLRDAGIVERIDALIDQRRLPRELRALVRLRRDQEWQTGVLLTDDFAPYDVLMGS